MGKSVEDKASQLQYLTNRFHMLSEVVESMDSAHTDPEDLDRLLQMMKDIEGKIERFKKDWEADR
ncbi:MULTISPECIES: SE1561 family protein [Pontibacillus]|uniref:SE1561 family protein n=1 Tax=Pontibacillus chungwhensis TaxID=265426 RepID=A0ABY8UWC4_9BACI|nr:MULTISPECIES: SE1561 family protein [Pontibacillus]MCD5323952.1 hypothetical protein [Pontibacillus sp. HN14]WIF97982.1 SE1561 family protein [Pontibacillus chungwhensis]